MATGASTTDGLVAVATVVPAVAGVPLAALAAVAAFQALRVPVGRASSWLLDR
jgi:hypothetical protein